MKPSNSVIRHQIRERLMRSKEHAVRNVKRKTMSKQSIVVSSNKMTSLRKNKKSRGTNGLKGEHGTHSKITSCPMKKHYKSIGREYEISSKENADDVKRRIENTMPLAMRPLAGSVMTELSQEQSRCNLLLYEAYPNYQKHEHGYMNMKEMSFKISFIRKDGQTSSSSSAACLSGSCMESILNRVADLKTGKRFLHDCTAINMENRSWIGRMEQNSASSISLPTSFLTHVQASMNYSTYFSQDSSSSMSQNNYFQPPHYKLQPLSERMYFTQESGNENMEEDADRLPV